MSIKKTQKLPNKKTQKLPNTKTRKFSVQLNKMSMSCHEVARLYSVCRFTILIFSTEELKSLLSRIAKLFELHVRRDIFCLQMAWTLFNPGVVFGSTQKDNRVPATFFKFTVIHIPGKNLNQPKIQLQVTDLEGKPVAGAQITFRKGKAR